MTNSSDATPVGEIVAALEDEGFTGQMAARPGGMILCFTCHRESAAADVGLAVLRRTEGASDPADMLAVAGLTCPVCGTKGTAVLGYGPEADVDDAEVLRHLDGR
jgi:hypothetical protein